MGRPSWRNLVLGNLTLNSAHSLDPLAHIHTSNCRATHLPYDMASSAEVDFADVRPALLQFMLAATPDDKMVNDILANYDEYLAKMSVSREDHFVNPDEPVVMSIDNVPDAVNPVRSSLTYIQVPNKKGDSTDLNLVWRVSDDPSPPSSRLIQPLV